MTIPFDLFPQVIFKLHKAYFNYFYNHCFCSKFSVSSSWTHLVIRPVEKHIFCCFYLLYSSYTFSFLPRQILVPIFIFNYIMEEFLKFVYHIINFNFLLAISSFSVQILILTLSGFFVINPQVIYHFLEIISLAFILSYSFLFSLLFFFHKYSGLLCPIERSKNFRTLILLTIINIC
jgi:hypothetical protein